MKISYFSLTIIFLLNACGGGGGDGGDSGESNSAPAVVTAPVTAIQSSTSLSTSKEFDFVNNFKLDLKIDQTKSLSRSLYINVCSDYVELNGTYQINYDSCLLRTSVREGLSEYKIILSQNETQLIAQLWLIEEMAEPVNYFWDKTVEPGGWKLTL